MTDHADATALYVWNWRDPAARRGRPSGTQLIAKHDAEEAFLASTGKRREGQVLEWRPTLNSPYVHRLHLDEKYTGYYVQREEVATDLFARYEVPDEIKELFDQLAGKVHRLDGSIMDKVRILLGRHEEVVTAPLRAQLAELEQGDGLGQLAVSELKGKLDAADADAAIWQDRAAHLRVKLDNLQATATRAARELGMHQTALHTDAQAACDALKEIDR